MPSRRSDRGNALKRQPGESRQDQKDRAIKAGLTVLPLAGLRALGALPVASALSDKGRKKKPKALPRPPQKVKHI